MHARCRDCIEEHAEKPVDNMLRQSSHPTPSWLLKEGCSARSRSEVPQPLDALHPSETGGAATLLPGVTLRCGDDAGNPGQKGCRSRPGLTA